MPSISSSSRVVSASSPAGVAMFSLVVTVHSFLCCDGVPGLVDRVADRRGVDEAAGLQIDLDARHAGDLGDLLLDGGDAVAAGHAGDGEGGGSGHGWHSSGCVVCVGTWRRRARAAGQDLTRRAMASLASLS